MNLFKYYCVLFFYHVPALAWKFSGGSFLRYLFLNYKLSLFLLTHKVFKNSKEKTFSLLYNKRKFTLELESSVDVAVLVEIFVLKEYDWVLALKPKTILDLGAHWGDSSIFYTLEYPEAHIVAVEPNPGIFCRLQNHVKQFPNILPVNVAVAVQKGELDFFVSKNSMGNSLERRSVGDKKIQVNVLSIFDLCEMSHTSVFDLIKFDIEGGEKYLFQDESIKARANAFIGEIHLDLIDIKMEDVINYFSEFHVEIKKLNSKRFIIKAIRKESSSNDL